MPGGQRSDVKEEGRTQFAPGDRSGVVHSASVAHTQFAHERQRVADHDQQRFHPRQPKFNPVPIPGVAGGLVSTQYVLQVVQDAQVVERMDVARNRLRQCAPVQLSLARLVLLCNNPTLRTLRIKQQIAMTALNAVLMIEEYRSTYIAAVCRIFSDRTVGIDRSIIGRSVQVYTTPETAMAPVVKLSRNHAALRSMIRRVTIAPDVPRTFYCTTKVNARNTP